MKNSLITLSTIFAIVLTANENQITFAPPPYTTNLSKTNIQNSTGSLFLNSKKHFFADTKAKEEGDILIVKVEQEMIINSSTKKKSAKNISNSINTPTLGKDLKALDPILEKDMSVKGTSSASSDGQGNNSRKEKITATISVRVVKVLANENLYIEGSKEMFIDGEKTTLGISGVIRPQDIATDNTISSNLVNEARLFYTTDGETTKATTGGKGAKIINDNNPY